ncbi:MAG: pilus assembly protein [Nitrospirae bacterium]|nr:MAG: pilus assembly protein [Nitrospirota bacterium]
MLEVLHHVINFLTVLIRREEREASMGSQKRSDVSGAAAIEFALVFPIFLVVLLGIIGLGIFLYNEQALIYATREGARYGILMQAQRPDCTQIRDHILNDVNVNNVLVMTSIGSNDIEVEVNGVSCGTSAPGQNLTVRITAPLPSLLSGVLGFVSGSFSALNLRAETTMTIE